MWEDLKELLGFLYPQERLVLRLIQRGKTPSDVATILEMNSRQHADREMRRVISMIGFYRRHLGAIEKLYGDQLPLNRRELLILRMYVVERMSEAKIGEVFYNNRWSVWDRIREAKEKLGETVHYDVFNMLSECSSRKSLRIRKRKIMTENTWREKVVEYLLSNLGTIWYVWGGQSLEKRECDCSGLVIEVLKMVGKLPKDVRDMTAQDLAARFVPTLAPTHGDLAFYGVGWKRVTHVMFYLGTVLKDVMHMPGAVAGMCEGKVNMKLAEAKITGAALWVRPSAKYRSDFLGYRRV